MALGLGCPWHVDSPWFKEFCAYDGGHVRREAARDTHAGRAGAPWTVQAAAMAGTDTATRDLGDGSNAARLRPPANNTARAATILERTGR